VPKQDFNPLLAAGYHPMTWSALEATCLVPFAGSVTRPTLTKQLEQFLEELRTMGLKGELWVDGSYVTDKPDPGDIDLVYVPDTVCLPAIQSNHARIHQLFAMLGAKAIYNCHAFLVDPSDKHNLAYWRGLFGFCHDEKTPKGLIVIAL
jgi:hypothetical protein